MNESEILSALTSDGVALRARDIETENRNDETEMRG
jgi:hypothetical protein